MPARPRVAAAAAGAGSLRRPCPSATLARMSNIARTLARLTALDDRAQPVVLGTLWKERTVVLAFVRHFG
jgi:hypothetical protein